MQKNHPLINPEKARQLLYQMMLIRRFEEKSAEQYTKGKIRGFLHLYCGQEAVAVGVMQALEKDDYVLSTYREHGHAIARGMHPNIIMAEMYGKKEGCSGGRGGSMHLFDKSLNFFGGNAIVGGHLPVATGMALAIKKMGKKNISCCFFGEGAASEGEFYESLNLAALWQVPALFICENNLYAMGTALRYSHAMQQIEKKADAFGMDSMAVDGMDITAVIDAVDNVTNRLRNTGKPFLLVCNTYRFRAHSMFDAELYRDKKEVEDWKKKDPITLFLNYLQENQMISDSEISGINEKVEEEILQCVEFAEAGNIESRETLGKFVYRENQNEWL